MSRRGSIQQSHLPQRSFAKMSIKKLPCSIGSMHRAIYCDKTELVGEWGSQRKDWVWNRREKVEAHM